MKIYPHCLCSIVFLHYFCRKIERGMNDEQNIIIYRTADGRASVALFAKDGKIWLNQQQMAELFATSKLRSPLCQGWQDMAQPATDGGTFCHLEA